MAKVVCLPSALLSLFCRGCFITSGGSSEVSNAGFVWDPLPRTSGETSALTTVWPLSCLLLWLFRSSLFGTYTSVLSLRWLIFPLYSYGLLCTMSSSLSIGKSKRSSSEVFHLLASGFSISLLRSFIALSLALSVCDKPLFSMSFLVCVVCMFYLLPIPAFVWLSFIHVHWSCPVTWLFVGGSSPFTTFIWRLISVLLSFLPLCSSQITMRSVNLVSPFPVLMGPSISVWIIVIIRTIWILY